jgi:uncharacterized damage-inducible protein DinB
MNPSDEVILQHFRNIRARTREFLDCLPDEHLELIAASEDRSLADWFRHICLGNFYWLAALRDEKKLEVPRYGLTRPELDRALNESESAVLAHFSDPAAWDRVVDRTTNEGRPARWNGRERLLYLVAHEVHHRAKWVLALRQVGFTQTPILPLDW